MATLNLGKTVTYQVAPAQTATVSTLTIMRIVDLQQKQEVIAFVKEINTPITLWKGPAYVAVGDWTQAEAEAELIAIVTK